MNKKLMFTGIIIGLLSVGLAWYWFSWKLTLIIFLALFGNNLEQRNK